jgi:hypothetical protein
MEVNMSQKERKEAFELLGSIRGQALVGYALETAIKEFSKDTGRYRQVTVISDMQSMLDNVFFIGKADK